MRRNDNGLREPDQRVSSNQRNLTGIAERIENMVLRLC